MNRPIMLGWLCSLMCLVGCAGDDEVSYVVEASRFEQSCSSNAGCMLVTTGDYCGCNACDKGAISTGAEDAYWAEVDRAIEACGGEERGCPSLTEERASQSLTCYQFRAICEAGTCTTQRYSEIAEDVDQVIDRSCQTDADCTTVPESFDQPCGCRVAISASDRSRADEIAWSQGGLSDASCDCTTDRQPARCVSGTCELENGGACETIGWSESACE